MDEEIWKEIKDTEGMYMISNTGRIKRVKYDCKRGYSVSEKEISISVNAYGYFHTRIKIGGVYRTKLIHRLIAEAFIPNNGIRAMINHKDSNRKNNSIDNLEWVTPKRNVLHSLNPKNLKSNNKRVRLNVESVFKIKKLLSRNVDISAIAFAFNTTHQLVYSIKINRTWKHISID